MTFYPNQKPFDSERPTFDSVPLEMPPLMSPVHGLEVTDNIDTFGDVPGNEGENAELPVAGYVAAQPHVAYEVELNIVTGGPVATAVDFHFIGKNMELVSSYRPGTLENGEWVTRDVVDGWKGSENIINPDAGFTRDHLLRLIDIFIPEGGYSVFRNHAYMGSPFFKINSMILPLLEYHPRWMKFYKAQRASNMRGFEGFVPKSYSAAYDCMGRSWGMLEYFDINGANTLHHVGTCLDICAGETVLDAAKKGKQQWFNVNGGAVLGLPLGNGLTTENLMLLKLLQYENVHFYSTALKIKRHEHLLPLMSAERQAWARNELATLAM